MIDLDQVQKVVDGRPELEIDRLHVGAGEIAAVVGLPGSGTDLLLDLLLGRTRPTAGTIRVDGIDPATSHTQLSAALGVLFAENALYPRRSARGHLRFDCRLRGLPKTRADATLLDVGLADQADVIAQDLAPGLQRRLAFGRAILHAPRVLVLVEPFAGCDDATVELMARRIRALADGDARLPARADPRARCHQPDPIV